MNPKVKNIVYCAMFACIIAILAQVKIDLPSLVPITLQTLGVYLISCYLKPKLAFISAVVYLFMGIIGLPVFTCFNGGIGVLLGPTGGYIFSFPIMALVTSLIINKNKTLFFKIFAMILGTIVCYFIGTLWFIFITDNSFILALSMCVIPFIPGDIFKIGVTLILSNKIKIK